MLVLLFLINPIKSFGDKRRLTIQPEYSVEFFRGNVCQNKISKLCTGDLFMWAQALFINNPLTADL